MASVNKWIGIGNLGNDPELRYLPNGDAVCNISIACTDSYKDKATGEKKEITEWVRISMFGKLAEIAGQYLKKGAQVYIEGALRTRKWQDKDGHDRSTTEVKADIMKMLGKREGGRDGGNSRDGIVDRGQAQQTPAPSASSQGAHGGGNFADLGDDIPFNRLGRGTACHCL